MIISTLSIYQYYYTEKVDIITYIKEFIDRKSEAFFCGHMNWN